MTDKIVLMTTCDSEQQATGLAKHLVEVRMAACVNILPKARSIYRWKDQVETADEWLLIIKSRRDLIASLKAEIAKIHTYEVPELIAFPIIEGSEAYLNWLDRELAAK